MKNITKMSFALMLIITVSQTFASNMYFKGGTMYFVKPCETSCTESSDMSTTKSTTFSHTGDKQLSTLTAALLNSCMHAKKIDLSNNDIQSLKGISNCTQLRKLNLSNNRHLKDISPLYALFKKTSEELYIDLSYTAVSEEDISALVDTFGNAVINYEQEIGGTLFRGRPGQRGIRFFEPSPAYYRQ